MNTDQSIVEITGYILAYVLQIARTGADSIWGICHMLSALSPALFRLRTTNEQIQPLTTDASSIYALKRQIALRRQALRDIWVIQTHLGSLMHGQMRSITFARNRHVQRRRVRRDKFFIRRTPADVMIGL
jgi:hypothetical protein